MLTYAFLIEMQDELNGLLPVVRCLLSEDENLNSGKSSPLRH